MENNEEYSDSRHTFGHEDIEAIEDKEEGHWPRPGRDLRAHLYKYILGLAVLVMLVLGAVLYLLNPFGDNEQGITTERVDPLQMMPEDRTSAMDTADLDTAANLTRSPSAMLPASPLPSTSLCRTRRSRDERLRMTRKLNGRLDSTFQRNPKQPTRRLRSCRKRLVSPLPRRGPVPKPVCVKRTAPSEKLSGSPKSSPAAAPEKREKTAVDRKTRIQTQTPEKKFTPETRVSKVETPRRPEIPSMPLWYVQVGAFKEKIQRHGFKNTPCE